VLLENIRLLADGISTYYEVQLKEGMDELPTIPGALAHKYCGGGHGGYALYLFGEETDRDQAVQDYKNVRPIEPFCRV